MPHKKQQATQPDEQDSLIEKVDAMMDLKRPDSSPKTASDTPADAPLDIFAGLKTAPKLDTVEAVEAPEQKPQSETPAPKPAPEEAKPTIITHQAKTIEPAVKPLPKPVQVRDEFDDPETDKAVDEITKSEGDAFFEAHDANAATTPKPSLLDRLKKLFT